MEVDQVELKSGDPRWVRSMMRGWRENIIRTHVDSMETRKDAYLGFLTSQRASTRSILDAAARLSEPANGSSDPVVLEVDERFILSMVEYWSEEFGLGSGLISDIYSALCLQFLRRIVFEHHDAYRAVATSSTGVVFIANHQTAVESSLFTIALGALARRPVVALSKTEHRASMIGLLLRQIAAYPGIRLPSSILYMDRSDQGEVLQSFRTAARMVREQNRSVLIHVEGTRARRGGQPVTAVSSALIDISCELGVELVPVRFSGGLPPQEGAQRLAYPVGYGTEDIHVGKPIASHELRDLPTAARRSLVLKRLNRLMPSPDLPHEPAPGFELEVRRWRELTGIVEGYLGLIVALARLDAPSQETALLLRFLRSGTGRFPDNRQGRWLHQVALSLASGSTQEEGREAE